MYHVHWGQDALNDLTTLWVQADSARRQAITEAAYEIERRLQRDPENEGESRGNDDRILLVPPLGLFYYVEAQFSFVRIYQVWAY
jgi:hypothetical protein